MHILYQELSGQAVLFFYFRREESSWVNEKT